MGDKPIVFDATLCDGEQSPGVLMTKDEKICIAKQLERLEVDVIETGFVASSNGDSEAVRAITLSVKNSRICSLARANDCGIFRVAEVLKPVGQLRIHTFIATSALHMEKKLRTSSDRVYEQAHLTVRFARQFIDDIGFSPEDGSHFDVDFLCHVLGDVIAENTITINLPDTVGYAVPKGYAALIRPVRKHVLSSDKAIWSVHCYGDLGMTVANSLVATKLGGVRQIECTVNDLGERADNTSLEKVVMAVRTRRDYFSLDAGVDTTQIMPASELVSQVTGFVVQSNKAVVGANVSAYALGIHQDGVLKACGMYETMRAEGVGRTADKIILGKFSSHDALKQCLQEPGIELDSGAELNVTFTRFEELADQEAGIFNEDIVVTVSNEAQHSESEYFRFVSLAQRPETGEHPHVRIVFVADGKEVTGEAEGNGLVDATLNAIESKVTSGVEQLLYPVNVITTGVQAQSEVTVRLSKSGRIVDGVDTDPDIVAASVKAYLAVLDKLQDKDNERFSPQI